MSLDHDFWITILASKLVGKAVDVAYRYVKGFVQAIALYWLFMQFVALFIASYQKQKGRGYTPALSYPSL